MDYLLPYHIMKIVFTPLSNVFFPIFRMSFVNMLCVMNSIVHRIRNKIDKMDKKFGNILEYGIKYFIFDEFLFLFQKVKQQSI